MKKNLKEIVIFLLQIFVFYLLPKLIGNIGPFGMVFLLLLITFILSIVIGFISKNKIKYGYPMLVVLFFIPTIWIYYNESAMVHSLWYFIVSIIGLVFGIIMNKIFNLFIKDF